MIVGLLAKINSQYENNKSGPEQNLLDLVMAAILQASVTMVVPFF